MVHDFFFCEETITIHFLVSNSTKNDQKYVAQRMSSTRKQYIQCKSIGANTSAWISKNLTSIMRCYCGCGCNLYTQWIILAQKSALWAIALLRYGTKLLLKLTANCTTICAQNGQKFSCTLTTKCVNISVSAQPFFTKQGPFYS